MEIKVLIKDTIRTGVSKIDRLFRLHRHKYLHQRKDPCEDTLIGVLLNLVMSLTHRNTTLFQLQMKHRHAINEQHQIATTVIQNFRLRFIFRLLGYLISTLPSGYFAAVINLEAHFFAKMERIIWIITGNRDRLTINKTIEL